MKIQTETKQPVKMEDKCFPIPVGRLFDEKLRLRLIHLGYELYVIDPREIGSKVNGIKHVFKQLDEDSKKVKGVAFIIANK